LTPPTQAEGEVLFDRTLARAAALLGVDSIRRLEFGWLGDGARAIPALPRDNADFAAQACFVADSESLDMRSAVATVRAIWLSVLGEAREVFEPRRLSSTETVSLAAA